MPTQFPVHALLSGLPNFLAYLAVSILFVVIFITVYLWITPYHELNLIHKGNMAATLALSGVVLGYVIPLGNVVAHAVSLADLVVWALVAAGVQMLGYLLIRMLVKDFSVAITEDRTSVGLAYGVMALALGLVSSACITY
jgi:putative membrane protein